MLLSEFKSSSFTLVLLLTLTAGTSTAFLFKYLLKFSTESFKFFGSQRCTNAIHGHVHCREHAFHSLDALKNILEPTTSPSTSSTVPQKSGSKPKPVPLQTLLNERALPNMRLVRALGLTNTFVSPSPDVHLGFVRRAHVMLRRAKGRGWGWVVEIGRGAVGWAMDGEVEDRRANNDDNAATDTDNPHSIPLGPQDLEVAADGRILKFDTLIQTTTLVVVLVALLGVENPFESETHSSLEPNFFKRQDIELISRNITILWRLSKKPDAIPRHLLEELNEVLCRLMRMKVGYSQKGEEEEEFPNPLDFVVPAWETLWRVVATTVAYAYSCGPDSEDLRKELVELVKEPTEMRFRRASIPKINTDSSPLINSDCAELGRAEVLDVRCIVAESMRLHPPSKHIGRSKPRTWWVCFLRMLPTSWVWPRGVSITDLTHVKIHADVGALLRCPKIWGSDVDSFVPQRHLSPRVTEEQNEAMGCVFGYGRLKCVAEKWAPMAAGVVAGAIIERIEEGKMEVVRGERGIGGRGGWEGWVVRTKK